MTDNAVMGVVKSSRLVCHHMRRGRLVMVCPTVTNQSDAGSEGFAIGWA